MNGMSSAGMVTKGRICRGLRARELTVVHVPPAVGSEADCDLDDLVWVDADGVLEAAVVVVDGVVELVVGVAPSATEALISKSAMPSSGIS